MTARRDFLLLPLLLAMPAAALAEPGAVVVGTHDLEQMRSIRHLTFPRVLLYNHAGALIERQHWPAALAAVKASAGDAFCCLSDGPAPPSAAEPPPDCKTIVYGADINEQFQGLKDASRRPLVRSLLPPHDYLIVEYYASWCSPCVGARKALETFMKSGKSRGYISLVVDFSALQS